MFKTFSLSKIMLIYIISEINLIVKCLTTLVLMFSTFKIHKIRYYIPKWIRITTKLHCYKESL